MKEKLLNFLLYTSRKFEELHSKLSEKNTVELDYSSLSPIDYGDEKGHYSNALRWALENRKEKDIKNIAITGPYGSGKSTILKTFQKNYKATDLKFLNISLATFKEEKPTLNEHGKVIEKDKEDLLRLIETSILQQIFYHEEDKNIPDSRFKKIKSYSGKQLFFTSVGILIFIIALINYFYPQFIRGIFKDNSLSPATSDILHYVSISIIISGFFFLVFKSIRIISSITINKLKFQNAEIGLGQNINKSILNHHLDEILYFFTIRPYNVVIIEDLDRFQETEIFTKLREINLLLNNSEKTNKKNIAFIYAVRDDMFSDNERIKFFDFIIPVIPVINSSNSSEILINKKKKYNYNITDTFIEDISFFIDDMRLLNNITNEFYLYKEKQAETPLNLDKLFAIITYKNIYPNDFVALSKNEGDLYTALNSKSNYINQQIDIIDDEIIDLKNEIKNLDLLNIKNTKELRQLYVLRAMEPLTNFNAFIVNDKNISIDELLNDDNFEYLKSNELFYKSSLHNRGYNRTEYPIKRVEISFSEIENKVDSKNSYEEKEQSILDLKSNRIDFLRKEIQKLEDEKLKVRNKTIAKLLQSNEIIDINISDNLNNEFITILLRNGYISEDYIDYISLFHEGSITRNDHKFIISVRNKQKLEFDYKLSKIEKIIYKINPINFNSEFILNYDLLDHILESPERYQKQIKFIFTKLSDESNTVILFIKGFIERTKKISQFVELLCEYWVNIWGYFVNDVGYSDKELNKLLGYIIEYSTIDAITEIDDNSNLSSYIIKDPGILNISNNDKVKDVITDLKLKFTNLDIQNLPEILVDFIYDNNHYVLNEKMARKFIKKYGEFDQVKFDNSNFEAIQESKAENLINYIEENIERYAENIFLKIETNNSENEEYLIKLLNSKKLREKSKIEIIKKVKTKISNLGIVDNVTIQDFLLVNNKTTPTWQNLLTSFNIHENQIVESVIVFINQKENSEQLSKVKIPNSGEDKSKFSAFTKKIIQLNEIQNESFRLITKSVPWWYKDLDFGNLEKEKVDILIENNVLNPIIETFENLKDSHPTLIIKFFENHKSKFINLIEEITFDGEDINLILKSTKLNLIEKNKILKNTPDSTIISYEENFTSIATILLKNQVLEVSDSVIKSTLISTNTPVEKRIELFNKNLVDVDQTFIDKFLHSLDKSYEKITLKNKRAKISKNSINENLLQNLEYKGYISSYSKTLSGLRVNHKRK